MYKFKITEFQLFSFLWIITTAFLIFCW